MAAVGRQSAVVSESGGGQQTSKRRNEQARKRGNEAGRARGYGYGQDSGAGGNNCILELRIFHHARGYGYGYGQDSGAGGNNCILEFRIFHHARGYGYEYGQDSGHGAGCLPASQAVKGRAGAGGGTRPLLSIKRSSQTETELMRCAARRGAERGPGCAA